MSIGLDESPEVRVLARAFARFDKIALGIALGSVTGTLLFLATAWLVVKGGPVVGPTLSLLAHYLPGYSVSWPGALAGLAYGFWIGFLAGWTLALLKNALGHAFLVSAQRKSEREVQRQFLDYV